MNVAIAHNLVTPARKACLRLSAAVFLCTTAARVQAQEHSAGGPGCVDQSARQCIDRAFEAKGGRERLQQIKSVRLHTIGHSLLVEQSYRQEPFITSYEHGQTTWDLANQRVLTESKMTLPESDPNQSEISSVSVAGTGGGVRRGKNGDSPCSLSELDAAQEILALGPMRLLFTAANAPNLHYEAPETLRSTSHAVVAFSWGKVPVRVLLNAFNHLPDAVETTQEFHDFWYFWGDVQQRTYFDNWKMFRGIIYPTNLVEERNGVMWRSTQTLNVEFDVAIDDKAFAMDVNVAKRSAASPGWNRPFRAGTPTVLAPGIDLFEGSWNSTIVQQADGIVILEAPISGKYTQGVVEEAGKRYPGMPVKAVFSTSDSWPHFGGVRFAVANDTTVLPGVANPEELVTPRNPASYYYIEQYRDQKSLFAGVAAFQNGVPFNVQFQGSANAKPERVFGQLVSPEYFSMLGVKPERGRVLNSEIDKPGNAPVVVITDRFWRNRLSSSPDALGQTLRLNGQTATIVGIAPKDFNGALPMVRTELFVPLTVTAALAPELAGDILHRRDAKAFQAMLRLAPGVTIDAAEAGLDTITRRLDEQNSSNPVPADKSRRVTLLAGGTMMPIPRAMKPVLVGFFSVLIGLVLTIAGMNLANMLLARGTARRKELAIRLAIGASRFRLIRQMMSEGILLATLGGLAGLALAYWLSLLRSQFKLPAAVPQDFDFSLDWHALVFTFVLALVCGIGFSLSPALQATNAGMAPSLKEGAAIRWRSYRNLGLRNLLVVVQVAGSLMLLLITGFLVMGIGKMSDIQTKFDANTMYLLSIDPARDGYPPGQAEALFEKLPQRLKAIGSIRSVALAAQAPFSIPNATAQLSAARGSLDSSPTLKVVARETIGAGYFATLSEPILSGREFTERDRGIEDSIAPVVLNETAARGLFGNENAIGQRVTEGRQSFAVVGVVPDLMTGIEDEDQPAGVMYVPLTRRDFARPPAGGIVIMVRSDAGTEALRGIRSEIASSDPDLAVFDVRTLGEYLEMSRSPQRLTLAIYGGIGVFGLVLAAIGLAGVTAYAVARRSKEIGIRMALGARKAQVLRLVLREGAALVTVGTALGFLGAMVLSKMLSSLTTMFADSLNVAANDPRLLVGAPLLLAGLAMLACYIPARRSAKIDPLKALREE